MNILLTGGSGFIGKELTNYYINQGHFITSISRSKPSEFILHKNVKFISADTTIEGKWQDEIDKNEVIINLTGATIFKRWNNDYIQKLIDTRILTTRNIVSNLTNKTKVLCNASAIGYYGFREDEKITENYTHGNDLLSKICQEWEKEADKAQKNGTRVVISRFGVVLGKGGGALKIMLPIFRFCFGGKLGDGKQWFPWIHIDDLCEAVNFLLLHDNLNGAFNFCSPSPVQNYQMTKIISNVMKRPALFTVPAFAMRALLGEVAKALLKGQRAYPKRLIEEGFEFKYDNIENAFRNLIN